MRTKLRAKVGSLRCGVRPPATARVIPRAVLGSRYRIEGSPTFVLDQGRQKLYGNVGYRVTEANVRELLHAPGVGEMSWC